MTIQTLREYYGKVIDEDKMDVGDDWEFTCLANLAMMMTLNAKLYDERRKPSEYQEPPYAFENTQYNVEELQPLIETYELDCQPFLFTDSKGRLSLDKIKDQFPDYVRYDQEGNVSERRKPEICHIANMCVTGGRMVKWARHNEIKKKVQDPYWRPTMEWPLATYHKDYVQFYPKMELMIGMTVVREPLPVYLGQGINVDPEMPNKFMLDVVANLLQLQGLNESNVVQTIEAI